MPKPTPAILSVLAALALSALPLGAQIPPEAMEQLRALQRVQGENAPHPAGPRGAQAAAAAEILAEPLPLTDDKLQGFLGAVEELKSLGKDVSAFASNNPGNASAAIKAAQASGAANDILKKHGFADIAELQRVGYNAALARMVLKQGGKQALEAELSKAEAEQAQALEQMKGQLAPEQLEAMKAQMAIGQQMLTSLRKVPDANVELMKRYVARMDALEAD